MPLTSFASVARRVTAWTSNLLATGVVLLLALGVGRQLVRWYRVDAPEVQPSSAARVPLAQWSAGEPIELDFGDIPYSIQRRDVAGDLEAARAALVAACREVAAGAPLGEPTSAESGLLELCRREAPIATLADGRQIFAPQSALPLVVAIRPFRPAGAQAKLASAENRVVMWGMATSAGAGEWHLYLAHAERRQPDDSPPAVGGASDRIDLPLPPGARRLLGLRDRRGGSLASFAGAGKPPEWMAFFSAWFGQRQWATADRWRPEGGVWRARYQRGGDAQPATADLEIGPDGGTGLVGFATIRIETEP